MRILAGGNVGIGLTNPGYKLAVSNGTGDVLNVGGGQIDGLNSTPVSADEAVPLGYLQANYAPSSGSLWSGTQNGTIYNGTTGAGSVGIGNTNPGAFKLKVTGDVAITGILQTQTGSDFAEEFQTRTELAPGTVVVMGDDGYKSAKPSDQAYDTEVIGVVSDNPSIIAGRSGVTNNNQAVVAMVGVVDVKVSAMNGSIRKGDLLTTSSLSGYAMKADVNKPGTIIGKALEDLAGARGEVKALVNLQ